MSRFDGARQGIAVWALGLAVAAVTAVAAALDLTRIPVDEGSLTAEAAIALVTVVVVTLGAAMGGGKAGERFHHRVERVGL